MREIVQKIRSRFRIRTRLRLVKERFFPRQGPKFLKDIIGLIHIGASVGQEKDIYAARKLNVAWIEPIPETFARLQEGLANYPRQRAFNYLLADQDDADIPFHITNNGDSSSILSLSAHKEIWPDVDHVKTVMMKSITLPTLISREHLDVDLYQALVLDTQGSELIILKGAASLLSRFKYIMCEVADFESYVGCCQLPELDHFLREYGFIPLEKEQFVKASVGNYFDVVYGRG